MVDEQVQHLTIALCASLKADDKKEDEKEKPFDPLDFINKHFDVAEGIFNVGKAIGDGESFLDIVVTGLECTGQWGGLLGKIIKAIAGSGGKSEENKVINEKLDKILEELKNISQQLVHVREDIAQGVADIIAHSDAAAYRDKIAVPSNRLWALLSKVFAFPSERTLKDFMELCKDLNYRPKLLITDMFTYLDGDDNILMTQLKSKNYVYSTLDTWRACFQMHMMTLAASNVFYYSFAETEDPKVIKEEVSDMLLEVKRLAVRMFDLDNRRAQLIHSSGLAEKVIKEQPLSETAPKDLFNAAKDLVGERPFAAVYAQNFSKNFDSSQCTLVDTQRDAYYYGSALIIPQMETASKAKEKNYETVKADIEKASKKVLANHLAEGLHAIGPKSILEELSEDTKKRLVYLTMTDGGAKEKPAPDGWMSPSVGLRDINLIVTEDIERAGRMVQYIMSINDRFYPNQWDPHMTYRIVTAFIV